MIISKIGVMNNKTNYSKVEGSKQVQNGNISSLRPYSTGDKVAFTSLTGTATAILQEALQAGASKLLGMRKVKAAIGKAHDLFDSYDVKPAIELAIQMDSRFGRSLFQDTDSLLEKAVRHVSDLSDDNSVNRDLKQKVLDHCFVHAEIPKRLGESDAQRAAEDLLADLDPRYFNDYKKFLISKTARTYFKVGEIGQQNGITQFRDIDTVLDNIRDEGFKTRMRSTWEEKNTEWQERLASHGDGIESNESFMSKVP